MRHPTIQNELRKFIQERNWGQFHTPANLAMSIAIEAGELLECFQWGKDDTEESIDELADVLTYCYLLADKLGVDPEEIIRKKLQKTSEKYPIEKSWGSRDKYNRL